MVETTQNLAKAFLKSKANFVSNFPGFESHKIFEYMGGEKISANEKIAYESAFGASLAGKRSVVTMKSVGLNVAADSYLHSMLTGVNAGMVLVVTDDVKVIGSQERFDSRHYFDFYGGLWFDPTSPEDAIKLASISHKLSEKYDIPVVMRLTNQIFSLVTSSLNKVSCSKYKKEKIASGLPEKYVVHPVYWRQQSHRLIKKNQNISKFVEKLYINEFTKNYTNPTGIIMVGDCEDELSSYLLNDVDILKLNTYPLPLATISKFSKNKKKLVILEQGDPIVYKKISRILSQEGIKATIESNTGYTAQMSGKWRIWQDLSVFFKALKAIKPSYVVSDVTQFTVESESVVDACLCLGASVPTTMGVSLAGIPYPFCVVGDVSFIHGGYLALKEANERKIKMGVVIIDNGGSWCTGGQKPAFDMYNIDKNIPRTTINLSEMSEKKIASILLKMKSKDVLSVLFIKTNNSTNNV